jgi:hypothetical protein
MIGGKQLSPYSVHKSAILVSSVLYPLDGSFSASTTFRAPFMPGAYFSPTLLDEKTVHCGEIRAYKCGRGN